MSLKDDNKHSDIIHDYYNNMIDTNNPIEKKKNL